MQENKLELRIAKLEAEVAKHTTEIEELKAAISKVNTEILLPKHLLDPSKATEFDNLKLLLESPQWPHAVDPSLICDVTADKDKEDRAEGIIDLIIDMHLGDLAFLDFGCGEGHVIDRARLQKPRIAVGYDIKHYEKWESWPVYDSTVLTTDWEEVEAKGPYNVVLLYDVIDHIAGTEKEVLGALKRVRSVTAKGAKVFVRCHPWCSRHGTHLYHKLNKAYAHLVFNDEELQTMGCENNPTRKVIHPLMTYQDWFRRSGFQIPRQGSVTNENIEKFFIDTPLIARRIKEHWNTSHDHKLRTGQAFPTMQMQQQFIDYVLI